jgi:hypothetical protein
MDEGYTINAVIATQDNGTKNFAAILDSGQTYFCPLYCTPTAIIAKTFGSTAVNYRLLSAFFGTLFILIIFLVTKIIFKSDKVALLASFFTSFSYWQIAWSRQARWYTMLEVFFWLAILFFYLFLKSSDKKRKIINFIFSFAFTVLAITTHRLAYLLPVIFFIFLLINKPIKEWLKNKKFIIYNLLFIIIFFAFVEYVLGFHFITHAIGNFKFHYNLPYYLSFYLRNYWPFIFISIYGLFSAGKEEKKKHLILWSIFFIYLIPLSFLTNIVHYRYLFILTPIFYFTTSLVIARAVIRPWQSIFQSIPAYASIIILIIIFFATGQGILFPKNFYTLESDNPDNFNRPYYAYTPQPNFNLAYEKIKENIKPEEIIISSHPHFNKIFLNQSGYWIRYDYLGIESTPDQIENNKEYYVGAEVINNLEELKKITVEKHGYLLFDYQSADGRIDPQIITYIQKNLSLFFYDKINSHSQVWVYKF